MSFTDFAKTAATAFPHLVAILAEEGIERLNR